MTDATRIGSLYVAERQLSPLQRSIEFQALKYGVGRQISCHTCGNILDVRRAALLTYRKLNANPTPGAYPEGKILQCGVLCTDCAPKRTRQAVARWGFGMPAGHHLEIARLPKDAKDGEDLRITDVWRILP